MSVIHNLSDVTDHLTGFDPSEGMTGGIGKGWLFWKLFDGLAAFNTNIRMITNASPTPAWLQGVAGTSTYFTEPAQSYTGGNGHEIRWYLITDPGLIQTTPNCIVYTFWLYSNIYYQVQSLVLKSMVSGGSLNEGQGDTSIHYGSSGSDSYVSMGYKCDTSTWLKTIYTDIPKVIWWKSDNAFGQVAINKNDNTCMGGWNIFTPDWTGYKDGVGAITYGEHCNIGFALNLGGAQMAIDNISEYYYYSSYAVYAPHDNIGLNVSSGSVIPSALLNWDSVDHLISAKLRINLVEHTKFAYITDEIDGMKFTNNLNTAIGVGGVISTFNDAYYLTQYRISDDRQSYASLVYLEDVSYAS